MPLGVAASFWVLKGLLAVASLATIFLVWKCARLLGRDPVAAIVLVGLNPIVLVWGLGGDHNDFLMVFFIVLGFYLLLLRARGDGPEPATASAATAVAADMASAAGAGTVARPQTATGPGNAAGPGTAAGVSADRRRGARWLLPLCALEIGAGAAFVTAAAIKASGAVLIPVVLAGLIKAPAAASGA